MDPVLPPWAVLLRDRYLSGESSVFLLHGNVRDVQPWTESDGTIRYLPLRDFLTRFLGRAKEMVVHYNLSEGLEFGGKGQATAFRKAINTRRLTEGRLPIEDLPQSPSLAVPLLEDLLTDPTQRAGIVVDYLEMIAPNADISFMAEADKANLVTLQRIGGDPGLLHSDNLLIFVTEVLGDINRRLTSSAHIAPLEIPRPDKSMRADFLRTQDKREIRLELSDDQLANITAGLTLIQIQGILRQARQSGIPISFPVVNRRKKAIIEQECHGLVEFVDPGHGFAEVGGMDAVKVDLMRITEAIKKGLTRSVPMGLIFVGPMGTGKTFLAEAFARESGLTCLKFKNFREKWVGSTEANLEKVLQLVDGLGYVLLIIDEADRSLSSGDTDGGTSSRVIARLKEFMSDTRHRGRVVMMMMTNRPDKLDVDLKRPGRFDLKIPFFFPQAPAERKAILEAVWRRAKVRLTPGISLENAATATQGWSAAELEALALAATNLAAWDNREQVGQSDLDKAVSDVIPSRDTRMLEYMELLAVFESSSRGYLPDHYRDMPTHQVQDQLDLLRARLGHRVA
jgi:hypothetical protein